MLERVAIVTFLGIKIVTNPLFQPDSTEIWIFKHHKLDLAKKKMQLRRDLLEK